MNQFKNIYFLKKRNVFNFKFTIEGLYNLSFNQGQFGGVKDGTINYYTETKDILTYFTSKMSLFENSKESQFRTCKLW